MAKRGQAVRRDDLSASAQEVSETGFHLLIGQELLRSGRLLLITLEEELGGFEKHLGRPFACVERYEFQTRGLFRVEFDIHGTMLSAIIGHVNELSCYRDYTLGAFPRRLRFPRNTGVGLGLHGCPDGRWGEGADLHDSSRWREKMPKRR